MEEYPHEAYSQQDNATWSTLVETTAWFEAEDVTVVPWPAKSPDCNPIENLWGIVTQKLYEYGRQYDHLADLEEAIVQARSDILDLTLRRHEESFPKRLVKVIEARGGPSGFKPRVLFHCALLHLQLYARSVDPY